jgi:hypothetical protein
LTLDPSIKDWPLRVPRFHTWQMDDEALQHPDGRTVSIQGLPTRAVVRWEMRDEVEFSLPTSQLDNLLTSSHTTNSSALLRAALFLIFYERLYWWTDFGILLPSIKFRDGFRLSQRPLAHGALHHILMTYGDQVCVNVCGSHAMFFPNSG